MKKGQIERHHHVELKRRIADVRPWGQRTQEWLAQPSNYIFFAGGLSIVGVALPMLLPLLVIVFLVGYLWASTLKSYLPYRYPAYQKKNAPDKKKADGILYIGAVRSDSPYEKFKQCWINDNELRKHWLILGTTGSGKSETLKGIFYNSLCWGSGFFCADGKADNSLPTDGYTMARAFGRDDDVLHLNFLLGGETPQNVARSRRKRSNGINPFSSGDADTLVQMGTNLLPKAEGDGKAWQEKAIAVWRAVITALCYKRDMHGFNMSVSTIIDYLSLHKIEELYVEGANEALDRGGVWSYGYSGIKAYLDSGCPAYSVEKLRAKHGLPPDSAIDGGEVKKRPPRMGGGREHEQDPVASEQHGYRTSQLLPVLSLLDGTYSYIFRAVYSEIDMIDVALHNRILFLLIPSLEKSSQEAENLGKLAIACLRVMMARNLGSELEGTREELIESKATNAPYPYIVALDELGYYFADGIAVMFAQARSLGISMIAAAQDLEKLTEGERSAEAGAMIGNTTNKLFMKIVDHKKTWELVSGTLGKVQVASYQGFESTGGSGSNFKRDKRLSVSDVESVTFEEIYGYKEGQAVLSSIGHNERISTFYMGKWLEDLGNKSFHLNRFLQVHEPEKNDIETKAIEIPAKGDRSKRDKGRELMSILRAGQPLNPAPETAAFNELSRVLDYINTHHSGLDPMERGIMLYLSLRNLVVNPDAMAQVQEGVKSPDVPMTAELFSSPEAATLGQSLDEHGMANPLTLIRKKTEEVLEPLGEQSERQSIESVLAPPLSGDPDQTPAKTLEDTLSQMDFEGQEGGVITTDALDDMLKAGHAISRQADPAQWVARSVHQAHQIATEPRSADGTVVGLSEDALTGLEDMERQLGSPKPKTSAHTMQKVVAAQVTPNTIGSDELDDDEIDTFFNSLSSAGAENDDGSAIDNDDENED